MIPRPDHVIDLARDYIRDLATIAVLVPAHQPPAGTLEHGVVTLGTRMEERFELRHTLEPGKRSPHSGLEICPPNRRVARRALRSGHVAGGRFPRERCHDDCRKAQQAESALPAI